MLFVGATQRNLRVVGEAVADELGALARQGAEVDEDVGAFGGCEGNATEGDGCGEQSLVGGDGVEGRLVAEGERKKRPLEPFMRRKR